MLPVHSLGGKPQEHGCPGHCHTAHDQLGQPAVSDTAHVDRNTTALGIQSHTLGAGQAHRKPGAPKVAAQVFQTILATALTLS